MDRKDNIPCHVNAEPFCHVGVLGRWFFWFSFAVILGGLLPLGRFAALLKMAFFTSLALKKLKCLIKKDNNRVQPNVGRWN